MKKIFIKAMAGLMLTVSATSCGDKFLDTDIYDGTDNETLLATPDGVGVALNGAYYRLSQYYFAGNYATTLGDISSDIIYWNATNSHQNASYQFNYLDTYYGFEYIWVYGYKVIDNAARVLQTAKELMPSFPDYESDLYQYQAEAYALRAYAMLVLTNTFGHQVKVNGQDFSNELGVSIVDTPVPEFQNVKRSSVGECYTQILNDLNASIAAFDAADQYSRSYEVFTPASVYGLMARVKLYLEDYSGALAAATKALELAGITELATTASAYENLYATTWSNKESLFYLALDTKTNWSANSCGTLFTTYCYGPSPYLVSLYGDEDVRTSIMYWTNQAGTAYVNYGAATPWYGGGKFGQGSFNSVEGGNPAYQTNYLINAPEMFLIQAEANIQLNNETAAKKALLTVAMRDNAITSVEDLPSGKAAIMDFIKDERARELFQEGHRLWDLRRWGKTANLYAYGAPALNYQIEDANMSDIIFPIPQSEINAGYGIEQTPGWANTRP